MNMFAPHPAKTPKEYIDSLEEPRKSEIKKIHEFISGVVPEWKPYMLSGMISYGAYHYTYASGREGDWMKIGLCSRKNSIAIYICMLNSDGVYLAQSYKNKLKAKIGKSCINFKKFEDIDFTTLKKLLTETKTAKPLS